MLLPSLLRALVRVPVFRRLYRHVFARAGTHEYVIAGTKYIDAVFKQWPRYFDQVLLFGAGFDTRALRFQTEAQHARIFELDSPPKQQAKLRQYHSRCLPLPSNLMFIALDYAKELEDTCFRDDGVRLAVRVNGKDCIALTVRPQA